MWRPPPFWTKNRITGKKGRLRQKCTKYYKIAAMRRELRKFLNEKFNISLTTTRLPPIKTWIGFTSDEQNRINGCKSEVKYIELSFPLAEMGLTKEKTNNYYKEHGITEPPSSVCNACFANGLTFLEDMYFNRPNDWDQAVLVDEAIRDMRQLGVEDECFVSSTLIPLKDLPRLNFKKDDVSFFSKNRCNSGACFL